MNLPKGFGLVVDYVVPNSPAAAAGIQQNDILKLLNDQILLEPNQLRKLLQSFPDGTTVTLTILRKGQEQKLTAKLTKKDVPKRNASMNLGDWGDFNFDFNFDDMGHLDMEAMKERMQDMKGQIKEQLAQRKDEMKERLAEQKDMIRETVMKAQEAAQRAREEAQRVRGQQIQVRNSVDGLQTTTKIDVGKAQIVFSDDKGELRIEPVDGKKVLTAKDPKGLLLFSGPVETPEDINKMPADVRQRFEQLQGRDLPSVFASQQSFENEDEDMNDSDDEDDNGNDNDNDEERSATEQVSITPQQFPRSVLVFRTILI